MPWKAMAQGPQPASKSVLLDYVSPWNVLALVKSLRKRHYVVSVAILGSLLIKLTLVFSTGLFAPQLVTVEEPNILLVTTDKFDGSNYDSKFVDARAMYATYGTQVLNMSYPQGTTAKYAVQSFNDSIASNSTLLGVVDAFSADFECETGPATVENISSVFCSVGICPLLSITVAAPSCQAVGGLFMGPEYHVAKGNAFYSASIQNASCSNLPPGDDSKRVVLSLQQLSYNGSDDDPDFRLLKSTNLVCRPTYNIEPTLVTAFSDTVLNGSSWNVSTPSGAKSHQLSPVSAWDIAMGLLNSMDSTAYLGDQSQELGTQIDQSLLFVDSVMGYRFDTFFTILGTQLPNNLSQWFDVNTLNTTSRHMLAAGAAQLAKQFLTVGASQRTRPLTPSLTDRADYKTYRYQPRIPSLVRVSRRLTNYLSACYLSL